MKVGRGIAYPHGTSVADHVPGKFDGPEKSALVASDRHKTESETRLTWSAGEISDCTCQLYEEAQLGDSPDRWEQPC